MNKVQNVIDFEKCPLGGCLKMCNCDLPCGHTCGSICHILDREHKLYQCKQQCSKFCPFNHPCNLKCWQKCKPCQVKIERQLTLCGHSVEMPCSAEVDKFLCYIKVFFKIYKCSKFFNN